jgi:Asp-tRNA(Asn)/Glu-tRNA(Gln) amidotransferase A subunit family amidase
LRHPEAVASLTLVSAGSGQTNKDGFRKECLKKADELEQAGLKGLGDYSRGPTRRRFEMKAPAAHKAYFVDAPFGKHSAKGRANTLRGFQTTRPVWYEQEAELKRLHVPTLVVVGDEDEPCIAPGLFLKKHIPVCGLSIMPQTGHTIQVEEPIKFNRLLGEFLSEVEGADSLPGMWVPLTGCVTDAFTASMGAGTGGTEPSAKRARKDNQHDARGQDFAALPKPRSCAASPFPLINSLGDSVNYARSELSQLISETLDRIDSVDKIEVRSLIPEGGRRERLLKAALESNSQNVLRGMLVGVKDIISVEGLPTKGGSALPEAALQMPENPAVSRLRAAGALIVGKTTTTDFAMSDPSATSNPHDTRRTPGGSSSGSAAAVAAGFCHLALGTQTGGSMLRPAGYCGVFGFKATHGRIPAGEGLLQLSKSLDHVGVFACSMPTMVVGSSVLLDWWSSDRHHAILAATRPPCIAVPDGPLLDQVEPETMKVFEANLKMLADRGFVVKRLPSFENLGQTVECHKRLLAHDVAKEHHTRFEQFGPLYRPTLAMQIILGRTIPESEACRARETQGLLADDLRGQLADAGCDFFATPTTTSEAPLSYSNTGSSAMQMVWTFAGMPAITVPAGVGPYGMPLGLQLIAARDQDEVLLAYASRVTAALAPKE